MVSSVGEHEDESQGREQQDLLSVTVADLVAVQSGPSEPVEELDQVGVVKLRVILCANSLRVFLIA